MERAPPQLTWPWQSNVLQMEAFHRREALRLAFGRNRRRLFGKPNVKFVPRTELSTFRPRAMSDRLTHQERTCRGAYSEACGGRGFIARPASAHSSRTNVFMSIVNVSFLCFFTSSSRFSTQGNLIDVNGALAMSTPTRPSQVRHFPRRKQETVPDY